MEYTPIDLNISLYSYDIFHNICSSVYETLKTITSSRKYENSYAFDIRINFKIKHIIGEGDYLLSNTKKISTNFSIVFVFSSFKGAISSKKNFFIYAPIFMGFFSSEVKFNFKTLFARVKFSIFFIYKKLQLFF